MKDRRLVAVLACRNDSTRLYGKPLQLIDVKNRITVLEHIIYLLKKLNIFHDISLGIADSKDNYIYEKIANKQKINFVYGPEKNVVKRLILCAKKNNSTDIFRVTSESPFLYYQMVKKLWNKYKKENLDAIFFDNIVDGCGFEIVSLKAINKVLKNSKGDSKEHVTKYLRKNIKKFNIIKYLPPKYLFRKDIRLTIDNPEDLILCRNIFMKFRKDYPYYDLNKIIKYLDKNHELKNLVKKYTKDGYKKMYI